MKIDLVLVTNSRIRQHQHSFGNNGLYSLKSDLPTTKSCCFNSGEKGIFACNSTSILLMMHIITELVLIVSSEAIHSVNYCLLYGIMIVLTDHGGASSQGCPGTSVKVIHSYSSHKWHLHMGVGVNASC